VQQSLEIIAKSFKTRKITKPISAKIAICCAFKSKPLMFSSFEPDYFMQMVDSMIPLSAHDGECIITQGDTMGEYFYAIEKGTFLVEIDNIVVAQLPLSDGSGNCFGELAMLFNSPRNATIRAKGTDCKLWALDRDTFRIMQYRQKKRKVIDACDALSRVKLLFDLNESQLRTIAEVVNIQKFKDGDVIIQKGDTDGREFFMIQKGFVQVQDILGQPSSFTVSLQAGDSFGEGALLTSEPRNATIVAVSDNVVCMSLSFRVVNNLFGSLETLIAHNYVYYTLTSIPLLEKRSDVFIRKLSSLAVKETVQQGDVLAHLYELCDRFAVIRKGICIIEETGEEIGSGSYIGVELFGSEQPAHFSRTVIATTDVEILEIAWDVMQHMGDVNDGGENNNGETTNTLSWDKLERDSGFLATTAAAATNNNESEGGSAETKFEPTTSSVLISSTGFTGSTGSIRRTSTLRSYTSNDLNVRLDVIGVLGKGAFGRVELAKDKRDDTYVALKIQQKQHLVDIDAVDKVQQECALMRSIHHTFICRLHSTFQDQNCIYMALEFLIGGELFSLIDRKGGALSIQDTKFYAAPLVSALEYLHEQNIVYRDVKTENVVLDSYGYPVLVDFGFAKQLNQDSGITFTICGTTEFLAPEVILGSGHGCTSDCWSFGIMVHELLSGGTPFSVSGRNNNGDSGDEGDASEPVVDPMMVIRCVLEQEIVLDSDLNLDEPTETFILDLLDRNQATRLGCGKQILMSKHLFFVCEEEDHFSSDEYAFPMASDRAHHDESDEERVSNSWWSKMMRREVTPPWVLDKSIDVRAYFEIERFEGGNDVVERYLGRDDVFNGF